jgi:hypothetical protein
MPQGDYTEISPRVYYQSLYEASSTKKHGLGTVRQLSDGRVFVYGQAGAANLAAGVLVQGPAPDVANHGNIAVAANANIGNRSVTVTLGNLLIAANFYQDGWMHISDATYGGKAYKIKSHANAAANANLTLNLYDAIRDANLTTSAKVTLTAHPCSGVIIHPSPPTSLLVGVPVVAITANYYGWFQTKGPAPVLTQGTLVAGNMAYPDVTANGAVGPANANAIDNVKVQDVGRVISVNANTHYSMIQLDL